MRIIIGSNIIDSNPIYPTFKSVTGKLEVLRRKLLWDINKLMKILIFSAVKKHLSQSKFIEYKRKQYKKLDSIYNLWLFTMYGMGLNDVDGLIPTISDGYDFQTISDSFSNIVKLTSDESKQLFKPLKELCNKSISIIKSKYSLYCVEDNITVKNDILGDKIVLSFELLSSGDSDVNSLTVSMHHKVYEKLKKQYNGETPDYHIALLMYRYNSIIINNQFAAMPDEHKDEYIKKYDIQIELFAAGFNNYCKTYCSLFYEIEKYFGSIGNFFHTKPISGSFFMNPPYITEVMEPASQLALESLINAKKAHRHLRFVEILPAWHIKDVDYNMEYYNIIKRHPVFIEDETTITKDKYRFYSYADDEYHNLTDVVIFTLST